MRLLEKDVQLLDIQASIGHESTATTQIYTHAVQEPLSKLVADINFKTENRDCIYLECHDLEDLPVIVHTLGSAGAHRQSAEKALLERLIEKKKQFLDSLLDQTLEQYQEDNA
jgi:hypothetical protein